MRLTLYLLSTIWMFAALSSTAQTTTSPTTPAKQWEGKVVVMANGELLGRVEDLAVNFEEKTINYVVVSVGSFLIDQNLIAVDPDALHQSDDGFYLVLHSDNVDGAQRFGQEDWPASADVLPSAYLQQNEQAGVTDSTDSSEPNERQNQIATISDGQRKATIRSGDISATIEADPSYQPPAPARVQQKNWRGGAPLLANGEFERLDEDGDGYLTRQEISSRLSNDQDFAEFDYDGNEGIDVFEFQVMIQR